MRKKRFQTIEYIKEKTSLRRFVIVGDFERSREKTEGPISILQLPLWMAF